jgi:peptidoglycan/LPS O-acetylase OafA/YrhL
VAVLKYREDIDALRGISVFLVVIFHFFPEALPGGFVGVDVFFVISGFIITNLINTEIDQKEFFVARFYARRIKRLFPSLIFVFAFVIIFGWFFLYQDEFLLLGNHLYASAFFYQNISLIEEIGYFDVGAHYKQLLHFWSLSIEEQYYVFWPILLVLLRKSLISPVIVLLPVFFCSFLYLVYSSNQIDSGVFFHSLSRVLELSLGSLLAVSGYKVKRQYSKWTFSLGLLMISYAALYFSGEISKLAYHTLIPVVGAILIISSNVRLTSWGGFLWLGKISYSLYLWHWVLLSSAYIYIGRAPSIVGLILIIILSLLLSVFSKRYVESIRYISSRTIVPILLFCMFSIASIAWNIQDKQGFPNREHLLSVTDDSQFKRTPSKDVNCSDYANKGLQEPYLFDYCRSNLNNSKEIIAIVGDSHAHALFPGLMNYAENHEMGSILLANSSCPPLIGFLWGRSPEEIEQCKTKIDQIFSLIEQDKRITKVIIATRGPVYIHGETPGKATITSVKEGLDRYTDSSLFSYESFHNGLSKSIKRINNVPHVAKIFYMLENPELDFRPKELARRPYDFFNISSSELSSVDRDLYDYRMAAYREGFFILKAESASFEILDVRPVLCDQETCAVFEGNTSLYADDDHFSIHGSFYVTKGLEAKIFID